MVYHLIAVTHYERKRLKLAKDKAKMLFKKEMISGDVHAPHNNASTFFIGPDGADEDTQASRDFDYLRKCYMDWLKEHEFTDVMEAHYYVVGA